MHTLSYFRRYRHFIVELPTYNPDTTDMPVDEFIKVYHSRYLKLLEMLDNSNLKASYNLVWTERWMMMVLRSKEHVLDKYSVNCLGAVGSMLVKTDAELKELAARTPTQMFDEIFALL